MSGSGVSPETVSQLSAKARQIRQEILRLTYRGGGGYPGSSLSVADLVAALVFHELRLDPEQPEWPDRDRLVLSDAQAAPALFAALGHRGFVDAAKLAAPKEVGGPLPGHVDGRKVPTVEALTGAEGQGLGMGVGMALDARLARRPSRIYAIVGDGECRAGPTWEAVLAAGQYALDNLVVLVDRNSPETNSNAGNPESLEPLPDKFRAFRWEALEVDGHNFPAIFNALAHARATKGRPTAVIARTTLGKGVSFMENQPAWREKVPDRDEAERALAELGGSL